MTEPIHKTFEIKVLEHRKDGGRIVINTASVDRDKDRVMPVGARIDNYLKNPVVVWGHDYRSVHSVIGKTTKLEVSPEGIVADFELRPAANEHDPQNIIRLLWEGEWIRTASIGFIPVKGKPNNVGGTDYEEWELLEWSAVVVPSNQDAIRLAFKGMFDEPEKTVNSGKSKIAIIQPKQGDADEPLGRAWVRRLTVESGIGKQTLYAIFRTHTLDIPVDSQLLQMNWVTGECTQVPDPDAGKTVTFKDAVFVPPLEFVDASFGKDAVYVMSARDKPDQELISPPGDQWEVIELSDVVDSLPVEKNWLKLRQTGYGIDVLTRGGIGSAQKAVRAQIKRGRVLSAKNEQRIRDARDNLDEVLKQLESDDDKPAGPREDDPKEDGKGAAPLLDANGERDLADGLQLLINTLAEEYTQ